MSRFHCAASPGRITSWSPRGQLLTELALSNGEGWTQGYPVRAFAYDGAGRMIEARVFTQTTEFAYNGLGARLAVSVDGYGTTRYTLDYAAGNRILAETTPTETVSYLYPSASLGTGGHDCLGEQREGELALSGAEGWLYYLHDAEGYVRQGADADGAIVSAWLFDPDGTVLEGPNGPVSHLVCGGVYDWSTGLIYRGGRYFDPNLGIWLALTPLLVVQGWRKRKDRRQWVLLLCVGLFAVGSLAGCGNPPAGQPPLTVCSTPPPVPGLGPGTGTPAPLPPTPTPGRGAPPDIGPRHPIPPSPTPTPCSPPTVIPTPYELDLAARIVSQEVGIGAYYRGSDEKVAEASEAVAWTMRNRIEIGEELEGPYGTFYRKENSYYDTFQYYDPFTLGPLPDVPDPLVLRTVEHVCNSTRCGPDPVGGVIFFLSREAYIASGRTKEGSTRWIEWTPLNHPTPSPGTPSTPPVYGLVFYRK